jgi:hypothetical protein
MVPEQTMKLVQRAEELYARSLRQKLEQTHWGIFVSIEPDSGDHFLGRSIEEAVAAARRAHPEKVTLTSRIGFATAIQFGC